MTETTPSTRPPTRITDPADLLALVPTFFGFQPEDSLVLLTSGASGGSFHARVDLPADPVEVDGLAAYLASVAGEHDVHRVVAVTYTDDRALSVSLFAALSAHLQRRGVELGAALRADGERWWSHDDGGELGGGTRYDVSTHPLTAQAVLDGTVLHGSRQELADSLVGRDPDEIEAVGLLADTAADRLVTGLDHPLGRAAARSYLVTEGRWVQHRVRRFLADGLPLDRDDVARLAVLVTTSIAVRDVAWGELHHHDAAQHVALWLDVVRRVPDDLRAAPAALLGWAAWVSGNGALAWCAVERALESDPTYSLADLLVRALEGAIAPATWSPLTPEEVTLFHEEGRAP